MTPILPVVDYGIDAAWTFFLVFCRVGAFMFFAPAFGEQSLPVRVKLGCTIVFSLTVFPSIRLTLMPQDMFQTVWGMSVEILSGLFFGILIRLFVHALEIAGTIAAQSTSLSQLFGGATGADPQPVIGRLFVMAGLALACLLGLHVKLVAYLIYSYELIPMGVLISASLVSELGVAQVGFVFGLAFSLSAPFVLAGMLYNLTLGVINRAMPQLMVAFVGAPAITGAGILLVLLTIPFILQVWETNLSNYLSGQFP